MTRTQLVKKLRDCRYLTLQESAAILDALEGIILGELAKGEEVAFKTLGKFQVVERAARTGHNPKTGETIDIPAHKAVKFKPSKTLKEAVNQEKSVSTTAPTLNV